MSDQSPPVEPPKKVHPRTHVDIRREAASEMANRIVQAMVPGVITKEKATELAAQCWCDPATSGKVMDTELAQAFASRLEGLMMYHPGAPIADNLERLLLMGEKRGIAASIEYLMTRVNALRTGHANSVANHVVQSIQKLKEWADNSPNFITQAEQKLLREEPMVEEKTESKIVDIQGRKFFGQNKPEGES